MSRQLSLAARPKSLDAMIGQDKIVNAIRGHKKSGRIVKAWLFSGQRGTGKTTLARILALSYQCQHQTKFGVPCKECYRRKAEFSIAEINASDITGIDALREQLQGVSYGVMGEGGYRVYILDEIHGASIAAQRLLLKYLEDTPETAIFILCSTEPHKINEALRSRCISYEMRELDYDDTSKLVTRLLIQIKSDLPADRLVDALAEKQVGSPRLITQAVEKYAAGVAAIDAALVDGGTSTDVANMIVAVRKGAWMDVQTMLKAVKGTDIKALRLSIISYLRAALLDSPTMDQRTGGLAKAIELLCMVQAFEESVTFAAIAAVLYRVTVIFAEYKQ